MLWIKMSQSPLSLFLMNAQVFQVPVGQKMSYDWYKVLPPGVKIKLFWPEAKNSSPLFKFIELWGADLIGWGAILVEVSFYHSLSSQLRVNHF
jgi:hypothetical protein